MKKTYIIAEIGNTHEGSVGLAKKFIDVAASCGVDAVKFQTHIFEEESADDAPNPPYFREETRRQYFERTSFTNEDIKILKNYAEKKHQIEFLSSPFSIKALKILDNLRINKFKIPSGEVTNHPMLVEVAKTKKEVLLSTGMSSWNEIDEALEILISNGSKEITLLQCTSEYPCSPSRSGLNIISEMKNKYKNIGIGFSDHTLGIGISLAAVTLGATVIEKHLTLSRNMYGSDAKNSLEPNEFRELVKEIRNIDLAKKNKINKDKMAKSLSEMKKIFEKSIYLNVDCKKGQIIKPRMLSFKKPGTGISASKFKNIIGRKLKQDFKKNHKIKWKDLV